MIIKMGNIACDACQTPFECRIDRLCDRLPIGKGAIILDGAWDTPEGQTHHARGRLLGLHGRAGAGKSTIARVMVEDGSAALLHFATPIKSMARAIGLTEAQVNGVDKDKPCELLIGVTPRQFLQDLGAHMRATYGADVVAGWTMMHVDRLLAHGLDVIIDDVRLPTEAAAVWERQGIVIELTGRDALDLDSSVASAVTELPLDDRWIHDRIANRAEIDLIAAVVRKKWYAIARSGEARAW
jgi:hypothetical protein